MTEAARQDGSQPDGSQPDEGQLRVEWARASMPVLAHVEERVTRGGALRGLKVGIGLVLEPKTVNLAFALARAGATVSVYCDGASTEAVVLPTLRRHGITVFADAAADADGDAVLAEEFLDWGPDIIVDDGGGLIRRAHRTHPELIEKLIGATEETTSGTRPLRQMHAEEALRIPVIGVNDLATKYLFDNTYGTGQSCVMAFLDITNLQLAGRTVAVVGYGWVGKGVARHAAAMGARVVVSELDSVKALQAHFDGYRVLSLTEIAPEAEVVFACTGIAGAVTEEHVSNLPDGAFLVTAGGGPFELPMDYLHDLGGTVVRAGVDEYTLPGGRSILVLSDGGCINCVDGEGNPIEVMDLSLSLQALAVERMAQLGRTMDPGVFDIPSELEDEVARARLAAVGASLETLTPAIAAALKAW